MFTRDCPDTLASKRLCDLSTGEVVSLHTTWPAAGAAVGYLDQRINGVGLDLEEGDLPDAPLWAIVRWHNSLFR